MDYFAGYVISSLNISSYSVHKIMIVDIRLAYKSPYLDLFDIMIVFKYLW